MNLSADEIAALESGSVRLGILFRLDSSPIVRLWLGVGKIEPGVNAIDASGAVYNGFGEIAEIPEISRLINGEAERVTFMLSGVSEEITAIATEQDAPTVKGCDVALGFALFDDDWQLLGSVKWLSRYTADFLGVEEAIAEDPEQPIARSITLSVGSAMTGRWRPQLAFWTDQDQQARSSGDEFCERTPNYAQQVQKVWPDF